MTNQLCKKSSLTSLFLALGVFLNLLVLPSAEARNGEYGDGGRSPGYVQPAPRPNPPRYPEQPPHRPMPPPHRPMPPPVRPAPPPPPLYPPIPSYPVELRAVLHQTFYGISQIDLSHIFNTYTYQGYRILDISFITSTSRGFRGEITVLVDQRSQGRFRVLNDYPMYHTVPINNYLVLGHNAFRIGLLVDDVTIEEVILRLAL